MTALPVYPTLTRVVARSLGLAAAELEGALRPAGPQDFDDVLAFRRQHLHVPIRWPDGDYLRWRYRWTPGGEGFGDFWLLRRAGEPIAALGLESLACRFDSRTLRGVRGMDLLVRPDCRDSGLGVWLNATLIERHPFAIAMGANENSAGMVRRLFRPLRPRRTFTHPLDLGPFLARRWPRLRALAPALGPAANAGLAVRRRWLLGGAAGPLSFGAQAQLGDADIPVAAPSEGPAVHVVRDAAYLNRRLLQNPRRPARVRVLPGHGRVAGYMASATGIDPDGRAETHIVDWQCEGADALRRLLAQEVALAREAGHTCVRIVLQDPREEDVAQACGFVPARGDPGRLAGVQSRDAELAARLEQARWALTDASDDVDGF